MKVFLGLLRDGMRSLLNVQYLIMFDVLLILNEWEMNALESFGDGGDAAPTNQLGRLPVVLLNILR